MKKLLVVVDMINGFINEGALADKYINHITENIISKIEEFKDKNCDIVTLQDAHSANSQEFKYFPSHCVIGSSEAELIPELKPYKNNMKLIRKNSTSGFMAKEFVNYLNDRIDNLDEIVIVGCCTDICIINLAIPLKNYLNENNQNIEITVPSNCVETYNSNVHNRKEYNEMSFKLMKQNGINVI